MRSVKVFHLWKQKIGVYAAHVGCWLENWDPVEDEEVKPQ